MKKQNLLLYLFFLLSVLNVKGQEEETSPPINLPPLLTLIKNSESNINFNTLENFNNYGNTAEIDLNRKTVSEEIILASKLGYDESGIPFEEGGLEPGEIITTSNDLPADILLIDNIDFNLSGYNKIRSLGNKTIILGADTVNNCSLVEISEIYFLRNWLDTITRYENTYYSFVKDGTIILEVFDKNRLWMEGLSQIFDGISINKVGDHSAIQIVLTPNPASVNCVANFTLYKSGMVALKIVNQNATINENIFKGNLERGNQSIPFLVGNFSAGIYTVFIEFDSNIYSSTLIIR